MAESISKSSPPECSTSIFIIDSPRLQPNVLSCGVPCTLCVLYVHAPWGWSRSQCDPYCGWCHGEYPCVVSIMNTDGCRLRSAGGRRQVASISALFRVRVQVPESIPPPLKEAWNSRDPFWVNATMPGTQVIAPSSSSIAISISVPSFRVISLSPRSSSYPYSSRRSSYSRSPGWSRLPGSCG